MRNLALFLFLVCAFAFAPAAPREASQVRLKDLGKFAGWRENSLVGYGLVTGLAGTGDSPGNRATRQMLANAYSQMDLAVPADAIQSRNAAAVMVTAVLPPVARVGDAIDVIVTSTGDARSLVGGSLMPTALRAANGAVYALAQGALTVGGYQHDMNGNVVQKNHPTTGLVSNGATVEVAVRAELLDAGKLVFTLSRPDFTTASRAAAAINAELGNDAARADDAQGVSIQVPDGARERLVDFVARIERLPVVPDQSASVVVNERTGTVVAGGEVRIDPVAISHGELKISIETDNSVSQPILIAGANGGVHTALVSNSRVAVREEPGTGVVGANTNTVAELMQALARLKTPTRDMIAILQALKAKGALHAELVIQ